MMKNKRGKEEKEEEEENGSCYYKVEVNQKRVLSYEKSQEEGMRNFGWI